MAPRQALDVSPIKWHILNDFWFGNSGNILWITIWCENDFLKRDNI